MDLTVAAVPFYFGSMEAERRWLRAHADDPAFDRAQFERRDTTANLAMGTASLFAPLVTMALRKHLEIGRGRWAKPVLGVGVAAGVATTVADQVNRRGARIRSPRVRSVARRVSEVGSVTAVASIGTVVTSTIGAKLSTQRLWPRRKFDLGRGWKPTVAAIVGWDFIYYWNHRLMHESRFMWAIHAVHHSSERYNLSVALRQPVADALGTFVPYGLLCLIGISPGHVETARGLNLIYQYWIHTETIDRIGPFEEALNTASHHRVHHGVNPHYIDRNHGSILILWDRLFGTFQREDEPVVYGLTTNIGSFSPAVIAGHEHVEMGRDIARSSTWKQRMSYVVRGPGWAYAHPTAPGHREAMA